VVLGDTCKAPVKPNILHVALVRLIRFVQTVVWLEQALIEDGVEDRYRGSRGMHAPKNWAMGLWVLLCCYRRCRSNQGGLARIQAG
jgi:hypothetical protein